MRRSDMAAILFVVSISFPLRPSLSKQGQMLIKPLPKLGRR